MEIAETLGWSRALSSEMEERGATTDICIYKRPSLMTEDLMT